MTNAVLSASLDHITEFSLNWPGHPRESTHELVIDAQNIYVSGQKMDRIARCDYSGRVLDHFEMPEGSGPHGLLLDRKGRLWVSLEFKGTIAQLSGAGEIVQEIDVRIHAKGAPQPINPAPHGICLDADGETIWFTGKRTSTVGKINPDGSVAHYPLQTLGAVPIFLSAGPDKAVWGTELAGSAILHVTQDGTVTEYPIPTPSSRPIGIVPDPSLPFMWFTEEAGGKIGRIDMDGRITEFPVPALQRNDILGSLAFDRDNNLWVQVYVDQNNPSPAGFDYLLKFDRSVRYLENSDLGGIPFSIHSLPGRGTVLHRIRPDLDGNLWFTEYKADKLGKISL